MLQSMLIAICRPFDLRNGEESKKSMQWIVQYIEWWLDGMLLIYGTYRKSQNNAFFGTRKNIALAVFSGIEILDWRHELHKLIGLDTNFPDS